VDFVGKPGDLKHAACTEVSCVDAYPTKEKPEY
jgi:hypothetical protein